MWEKFQTQYALFSLRERLLVLGATLALVFSGGWFMVGEPIYLTNQKLQKSIDNTTTQVKNLKSDLQDIEQQLKNDPDAKVKQQIKELQQETDGLKQQLVADLNLVLSPESMTEMVKGIMQSANGVQIVELTSMPVAEISAGSEEQKVVLYKHPIKIRVQGQYFKLQQFVRSLKNIPYTIYWENVSYQVEQYPNGELTIEIYSVGTSKELLSV